jgi:aminocarboxymuconate-semialdehyde decarboxylase
MFGWPYETTAAMVRLVFSGVLEKYPNLKFITHHLGAMIPYFSERITVGQDYAETHLGAKWKRTLSKPPIEYFKTFYGDTALNGNTPALMCGHAFFGAEHVIFATDFPFDDQEGDRFTREVIRCVEAMDIPEKDKKLIFEGNARRLLRLP